MKASCSTLHTIIGFISPFLSHGFMKAITLRVYESRFLFLLSKFSRVLVAKLLEQGYPPFRFLMNPSSIWKFWHWAFGRKLCQDFRILPVLAGPINFTFHLAGKNWIQFSRIVVLSYSIFAYVRILGNSGGLFCMGGGQQVNLVVKIKNTLSLP